MAFRDKLAKLRSLAGEKGYRLERGVVRDTWILTHEKTGKHAVSNSGKTAFSVEGDQVPEEDAGDQSPFLMSNFTRPSSRIAFEARRSIH